MYDLVDNPPKNKKDLRDWLTSWIEKIDQARAFHIHGEVYTFVAGFSRSGYTHEILRSQATKEYTWWIRDTMFEASGPKDPYIAFPNKRYSGLDTVLEDMIEHYSTQWKLIG
jgi:hypothetical protein